MKTQWLLVFALWGLCSFVWAQTACPSGVPAGDPRCGPSPSWHGVTTKSQQPQVVWAKRWGAIAIDDANGIAGAVIGKRSKREAQKAAIAECRVRGGERCEIRIAYNNQCASVVWGKNRYSTASAETKEQATLLGMRSCRAADIDCQVYYENCSFPERIQ